MFQWKWYLIIIAVSWVVKRVVRLKQIDGGKQTNNLNDEHGVPPDESTKINGRWEMKQEKRIIVEISEMFRSYSPLIANRRNNKKTSQTAAATMETKQPPESKYLKYFRL